MKKLDMSNAPKFGRTEGLTRCLQILHNVREESNPTIVEIGCIRGSKHPDMVGDGWADMAFGWYCSEHGGKLYTIDRDENAIEICKRIAAAYEDHIEYICADSIVGLKQVKKSVKVINLLYLDGHRLPEYSFNEYMTVCDILSNNAIILIDDAKLKGKLIIPKLIDDGWNNLGRLGPQHLFVGK